MTILKSWIRAIRDDLKGFWWDIVEQVKQDAWNWSDHIVLENKPQNL